MSSSPSTTDKFEGWGAFSKTASKGELKRFSYDAKTWEETDVDIKVQYCGVCASDMSLMSSGWGPTDYPAVLGHEIVGTVIRLGSEVKHLKLGQLVGVGAQAESCLKCAYCTKGDEVYCLNRHTPSCGATFVYGAAEGEKTMGGFADTKRAKAHFVFPMPDGIDPAFAAPMLCGGITVYSPLSTYGAGTTAKDVGIIGVGGLGHFGILFAKALGANVTAISHSTSKKADAEAMGATTFIATHGSDEAFAAHSRTLDLIICTTNDVEMPLAGYLSLLRPGGRLIMVGVPEGSLALPVFPLLMGNVFVGGSAIGNPTQIQEMLDLAVSKNIKPWISKRSMENDINGAIQDMEAGKARYRYVLVNEKNGGRM